jgi:hypothetical protein
MSAAAYRAKYSGAAVIRSSDHPAKTAAGVAERPGSGGRAHLQSGWVSLAVAGCGDGELVEARVAERAGGDLRRWQLDNVLECAGGRISVDRGGFPQGVARAGWVSSTTLRAIGQETRPRPALRALWGCCGWASKSMSSRTLRGGTPSARFLSWAPELLFSEDMDGVEDDPAMHRSLGMWLPPVEGWFTPFNTDRVVHPYAKTNTTTPRVHDLFHLLDSDELLAMSRKTDVVDNPTPITGLHPVSEVVGLARQTANADPKPGWPTTPTPNAATRRSRRSPASQSLVG